MKFKTRGKTNQKKIEKEKEKSGKNKKKTKCEEIEKKRECEKKNHKLVKRSKNHERIDKSAKTALSLISLFLLFFVSLPIFHFPS